MLQLPTKTKEQGTLWQNRKTMGVALENEEAFVWRSEQHPKQCILLFFLSKKTSDFVTSIRESE